MTLSLAGWNVEGGGALQNVVAGRIAGFQEVDIWGLSGVNAGDAAAFESAAEQGAPQASPAGFDSLLGATGGAGRLLLLWNAGRFERLDGGEISQLAGTGPAPLWVMLRDQASQQIFIVMLNHLHGSDEAIRHWQAQALNAWAGAQTFPVIALGDYNFDWLLPNGENDHDLGYDHMTASGNWEWVRPAQLVTTHCSGWPCQTNSVLDFVFVAGPARDWHAQSQIVVVDGDFPDDHTTPNHRPVLALLSTAAGDEQAPPPVTATPPAAPATTTPASPTSEPEELPCPQTNRTANLRAGPGTTYPIVGGLQAGECVEITGRNPAGSWFHLAAGDWIAVFLIANPPPIETVPLVDLPAPD
jgi:hypothetical protein